MVCQWFYKNGPNKIRDFASDTIVKSLFKDNLPGENIGFIFCNGKFRGTK